MDRSHTIRWFRFKDRERRWWSVYLATPKVFLAFQDNSPRYRYGVAGLTNQFSRCIFIDAAKDRADQNETLMHEVMHAVIDGYCDGRDAHEQYTEEQEERVLAAVDARLAFVLSRAAGLRWPARPAGAASFERWARSMVKEEE